MDPVLEANQVSRRYGSFEALKPATFALYPGDMITLGGPNGAGKSTLLLCLSGLLALSSGTVTANGHDLYAEEPEARRALAYVPDVPVFYNELTAWEHLYFMALAHQVDGDFEARARKLLEDFGLWQSRDLFPHAFSRGMRLKLGLALALIRPFRVLLLDEPTSALDQDSVAVLVDTLDRLRRDGTAVLLSTHDPAFTGQLDSRNWRMADGELLL
ncbi:MAG: ABC transporter ATP-binding protein [Chloroflexi bacterium]|nr:MAG: ABC transporter ATP-binding protein [Chloroflexota bacterium]